MSNSNTTKSKNGENNLNWTDIEIPDSELYQDENDMTSRFLESVARVTFAGFAGALVGLSHQNKIAATGAKIYQRSVVRTNTTATKSKMTSPTSASASAATPPHMMRMKQRGSEDTNLPLMWATSFMAFVSILETSRLLSPTTSIVNIMSRLQNLNDETSEKDDNLLAEEEVIPPPMEVPWFATLADYTIGGTVAGLAGSASKRAPPASSSTSKLQLPSAILQGGRRSILMSGLGTGLALGFLAGMFQTALDAADNYLKKEQVRQELEQQRQQEDLLESHKQNNEELINESNKSSGDKSKQ